MERPAKKRALRSNAERKNDQIKGKIAKTSCHSHQPPTSNSTPDPDVTFKSEPAEKPAWQLVNEIVPDDKSLTIKLEYDPDTPVTPDCLNLSQIQKYDPDTPGTPDCSNLSQIQFLETGGSSTSPARSPVPHRRYGTVFPPKEAIVDVLNYGSESGDSDSEDEELLPPMLLSRVYQASMETPLDEVEELPAVELASQIEGALQPNDLFHFEWRRFPDAPIPRNERREPFTRTDVGPTQPSQDPYEIFTSIWDAQIMEHIVRETNNYAQDIASQRLKNSSLGHKSRICFWKDTSVDEMHTFFAITLAMGIVKKSEMDEYWSSDYEIFSTPGFRAHMSLHRFQLLNTCLHFNDNGNMCGLGPREAKLFKIEPIITHLNAKFQSLYTMDQNIALDESLMQWKGWSSINHLIPNKAAKIGIKTYELCECQTGYLWKFEVHTEKYTPQYQQNPLDASTPTIVLNLLCGLEGNGYTVCMDNFYNSPALARCLKTVGFDVVGTLRTNRQFVPQELTELTKYNMQKDQIAGFTSGDVDVMVWRDGNRVAIISTYHGNETTDSEKQLKPCLMLDYNVMMGGLDKKDQLLSMFPIERKRTRVWYKQFFRRLLNVSVFNSYIISKRSSSSSFHSFSLKKSALDHRKFRKSLIQSLLDQHSKPTKMPPVRTDFFEAKIHHSLEYPISGKSRLRRRCCVCKKLCHFYCAGCEKTVCISPCFVSLHEK